VPSSMIQAIGRPEVNAKIHALELPLYLALAWWMIGHYGILGAAIAWVLRVTVDTLCFFAVGYRVLPCSPFTWRNVGAAAALLVGGCMVTLSTHHPAPKILFALIACTVTFVLAAPLVTNSPVVQEEVQA
jgi:O-antigen/teichoic acid export membrane protein